ncbi:hypothetical protein J6590_091108 [Homalodisca vitripennis]|nr:hypothetical protein J6590_091108 [Homalodisca vitripennis]
MKTASLNGVSTLLVDKVFALGRRCQDIRRVQVSAATLPAIILHLTLPTLIPQT